MSPKTTSGLPAISQKRQKGAGLAELVIVVGVVIVLLTFSVFTISSLTPTLRADSALREAMMTLRQARLSSIDQRRNFTVTFQGTNEIVVVRQEVPNGTTPISDTFLPQGMVYMVFAAMPDTPDAFGTAFALNFACPGNTTPCSIVFQSDGSVLAGGALLNGTLFMGTAGNLKTARAVTVMGSTGRVRGYNSTGTSWF